MEKVVYFLIIALLYISLVQCYVVNPGPLVVPTKGAVWPKPQQQDVTNEYFVLRARNFKFSLSEGSSNCNLLQNALERYWKIIQENALPADKKRFYMQLNSQMKEKIYLVQDDFLGYLDQLAVNLTGACNDNEFPSLNMVENYTLAVTTDQVKLQSESVWGIMRGLESFSQLIYLGNDGVSILVNSTIIKDFPRYKHRGLLLDTARHYIPLEKIYQTLDALSYNKMNVFHWHIVDDQSFPYVSLVFPELSAMGAFNPHTMIYTPENIQSVIEYARLRGIRVLPEFDTPGHTRSWGVSHPELLTPCFEVEEGAYGPMDPTKNNTYTFLKALLTEVKDVFKDNFIHLGGDEVDFDCWENDTSIVAFMEKQNISTFEGLESYYIQKVIDMVDDLKYNSIVWEEVFNNGVNLPDDTLVHVWRDDWTPTMHNVTKAGRPALLSACWYLDHLESESRNSWRSFYSCEPSSFNGTIEQAELIVGGEACMWAESVNEYNVISRIWPRASGTAERLWSDKNVTDENDAAHRLEEHTCRMNRRGISAEPPNGPGFCL